MFYLLPAIQVLSFFFPLVFLFFLLYLIFWSLCPQDLSSIIQPIQLFPNRLLSVNLLHLRILQFLTAR
jgi:hypothetical protein